MSQWTDFPISRKWNAQWIWRADEGDEANTYVYFRQTFENRLQGDDLAHAKAFVTAESRYQLWINGCYIGRGVPRSMPFFQYYDEHEIAETLIAGTNCVAVLANYVGNVPGAIPCLLLEITGGGGQTICATSEHWRAKQSSAWQRRTHSFSWNVLTPYQEFFDARKFYERWQIADFDDSSWPKARVIGRRTGVWPAVEIVPTRLIPRDIPFPTRCPVFPERIFRVEETLDLENRPSAQNLAPTLSMVGKAILHSTADGVENLCAETGVSIFQNSTNHESDIEFDGIYAPAVVLDFGRVITATCRIELDGVDGGFIDIGYAERLIDDQFNIAIEGEFADRYIMKSGHQVFETFGWKAFRYLKLRFRNCFQPVRIRQSTAIVSTYPYEDRGAFNCGDRVLQECFEISRATVRLCSNESLMDTPWREQAQWLGDVALVTVPAIQTCFGDSRLPGKFIRQAASNQLSTGLISNITNVTSHNWGTAAPDYSLLWLESLWGQYQYTGEARWIHNFYPQALRILQAHLDYLNELGFVENMPYWTLIDWADIDRRGMCSAYNGIFHGAVAAVHQMADLKGDRHTIDLTARLSETMQANFNLTFVDPKKNCISDANIEGHLSDKISEHGNCAAICWGLCDDQTADRIIETIYVRRNLLVTEAQPYFATVVLRALFRRGRMDLALQYIRDRWGRRMVERGATSTFEEWYQNGSRRQGCFEGFLRSHSHAWSAAPADFLIRRLIGLTIVEPGCGRLRVQPTITPFDYLVSFPLPHGGCVTVRCDAGRLSLDHPPHIEVEMARAPGLRLSSAAAPS